MKTKKMLVQTSNGSRWRPIRDALGTLEQIAANGWYPARHELSSRLAAVPPSGLPAWVPEADVEQTATEVIVSFALPGLDKGDIRLQANEQSLTVSGRRRDDERPSLYRRELPTGPFLRRVHLPTEIRPATAKAAYRQGILRVTAARAKPGTGRSVKVE